MKKFILLISLFLTLNLAYSEIFDKIEIRVNDKFITKRMVDKYYGILNLVSGEKLTRDFAIKTLINILILEYYLNEKGITISDKDITREIESLLELNKINSLDSLFAQFKMKGIDITEKEFRDFIKKQITIKKAQEYIILRELRNKLELPNENEIKNFYEKNKNYFKTSSTVKISHLVVAVSDSMGIKEKIKVEETLGNISKKLKNIKNTENRISEFSKEVETNATDVYKKNKGDIGWFDEEKLNSIFPQYSNALKMNVGDVSDVVVTPYTRAIFIVTDKKGGETLGLEKVKDRIIDFILYDRGSKIFNEWLAEYSKKYEVIVK